MSLSDQKDLNAQMDTSPIHSPSAPSFSSSDTLLPATTNPLFHDPPDPSPISKMDPSFMSDFPSVNFTAPPQLLSTQSSTTSASTSQSPALFAVPHTFALPSAPVIPSVTTSMTLSTPVSAVDSTSTTLLNSASELAFSPLSGAPSSAHDPGFPFPPPDLVDPRLDVKDGSPDSLNDPHLMVVGDMLNK